MTRRALTLYASLTALAIVFLVAIATGAYDHGHESGMRDLCGELGGTWTASEHEEYCDGSIP